MSGGVEVYERQAMSGSDNVVRLPSRVFTTALTAGLWSLLFSALAVDALFKADAYAPAGAVGLALACVLGAGMCLGLGAALRRWPVWGPAMAGALIFASCMCAVVWTLVARGALFPITDALVKAVVGDAAVAGGMFAPPTYVVALVFLTWTAGWFMVAYADELRESVAEVELRRERIAELEARFEPTPAPGTFADHIWVPSRGGRIRVALSGVVSLSAEREYVRMSRIDGPELLVRGPLHALYAKLNPAHFVRVHRSKVVNVAHVTEVRRLEGGGAILTLAGEGECRVSRRLSAALDAIAAPGP